MTLYKWSQTASVNALVDGTCPWPEGMDPAQINDSARGNMAAIAKYRDDISGAIVTTGSATAYAVSSYQAFDSLADMHLKAIAFTPHVTNAAGPVMLNTDTLGSKPLRTAPNAELPAGTIIQGTPYIALYNNTDGAFYLQGFYSSPYLIPLGATLDYWGPTAPSSQFALPFGQPLSRSTYSSLFALIGTTYGNGLSDGLTFSLPDLRGRVIASPDNMGGGTDPNRLSSGALAGVRNSIGGAGGESGHTLTIAEMPTHTHANTLSDPGHGHTTNFGGNQIPGFFGPNTVGGSANTAINNLGNIVINSSATGISINNASQGSGAIHNIMQPTILCNRIMRII